MTVVTKYVEPYCIVAGNPARTVGKRFDDDTIRKWLETRWWDWPIEKINEVISPNIFYAQCFITLATQRTLEQAIQGDILFKVRDISLPTGLSLKLAPLLAARKGKSTINPAA